MTDPLLVGRVLMLLATANGMPILANRILGPRFDAPLDFGACWRDGRPLFGSAKTIRGIAVSLACTVPTAMLLGLDAGTGFAFAAASMAGDLASSFVKRRLGLPMHAKATGLDQIPEALLPMLLLRDRLGLTATDIVVALVTFVVLERVLSRLLYRLTIRDRPY